MNVKYNSIIILFYLCSACFIGLFIISMSFDLLGYWVGYGTDITYFFYDNLFDYFKVGLAGIWIGLIIWFFYYRKI